LGAAEKIDTINIDIKKIDAEKCIDDEASKNTIIEKDKYLPVLLVEDSEINIVVAQAILESFPIKVDVAKNGAQAIKMINQNWQSGSERYQAVFMDCQMPEMDGYQACS
jgi:response regulator RpfG family c-di-GMP phosphodiesterase